MVTVGLLVAVSADLPDRISAEYTHYGPGPSLQVPVRLELTDLVAIRVTGRADLGVGTDRVSWTQTVDGTDFRIYDDDHPAFLTAGGLTIGPEVSAPLPGKFAPYFGAETGVAWVGTYHALGGEERSTQHLLDPDQNDLINPRNVDPYTSQGTFLSDIHLGGRLSLNERLDLYLETGYSVAFVAARPLKKAPEAFDAQREAYGWNALRGGVGFGVSF